MPDEPTYVLHASEPGAAKALRLVAASIRTTDPMKAAVIDERAKQMDEWLANRNRPGAGFVARRD